jgi:hypothetical protein
MLVQKTIDQMNSSDRHHGVRIYNDLTAPFIFPSEFNTAFCNPAFHSLLCFFAVFRFDMAAGYSYNPLVRHSCSKGLGRLRQPRQPVIDPALKLFNEWIRANEKNGLWMHGSLTWVFNESSDFGVAAPWTDGLNNGETIVKVPKSLILSPHTVSNPEFRQILKENTNLDPMCKLAVAYIFESCLREMSPFFGYMSYITFPDLPRLWDDDELKLLRGTEVEIPYQKSKVYPPQFELSVELPG